MNRTFLFVWTSWDSRLHVEIKQDSYSKRKAFTSCGVLSRLVHVIPAFHTHKIQFKPRQATCHMRRYNFITSTHCGKNTTTFVEQVGTWKTKPERKCYEVAKEIIYLNWLTRRYHLVLLWVRSAFNSNIF